MSSNDKLTSIVPDNNTVCYEDARLLHVAETQLLHEATLQDLLRTWNYAVDKLLYERNQLLQER
jgi:hypothetical protein